jgi:pimeloyl-ACP methyl ester carboxylesterase
MHYKKQGTGKSLLLLHGFCEDLRIWQELAASLSSDYTVITPDLPGFGQSPVAGESLDEWAKDLHESVVKPNCPDGAVVIGHSMGGYVSLAYAALFPDSLKGLGLFHSTCSADTEEKKEGRLKSVKFVQQNGPEAFVKQLIPTLFAEGADKQHIQTAMDIAMQCSAGGISSALMAMRGRPQRCDLLKAATYPVLIIAGEKDAVIPAASLAEIAGYPDTCLFRLLKESGHMGFFEEKDISLQTIKEFMELT